MPFPYDENSRRTPEKKRLGILERAHAQTWIATRLLVLGHPRVAAFMIGHAADSLTDYLEKERRSA